MKRGIWTLAGMGTLFLALAGLGAMVKDPADQGRVRTELEGYLGG